MSKLLSKITIASIAIAAAGTFYLTSVSGDNNTAQNYFLANCCLFLGIDNNEKMMKFS
jgi:hypothetical protein